VVETIWKNDIKWANIYYQAHSPINFVGCTRQIGQAHTISYGWLLDVSGCHKMRLALDYEIVCALQNTEITVYTFWNWVTNCNEQKLNKTITILRVTTKRVCKSNEDKYSFINIRILIFVY